ncbi:MAG: 4Fe-4S dicluster domain-containing protein [Dehalococcoidia bacterium]|nr:4Fe-4S dicluster domain-containing protein [Dehalococcoidia bacterium]
MLSLVSSPLLPILGRAKASETDSGEDHQQEKKHAWSMVIDLKRCDGCTGLDIPPQCTQACISGHFAPKGHKWIEIYDVELPGGGKYFLPMPCYQCENAPCVNVCPVGATYHDKDGVVLIDHHRCIGCRMCMAACPYQRRFFNWGKPEVPPEASLAEYSPLYPVPAVRGTVIKCMFCAHYLQDGRLPYCVTACPRKALYIGDLNQDIAGNGTEIVKLSKFLGENDAFRNKEDLGTQPRVFYLPGHGQDAGRKADDDRPLLPNTWAWGGEGYNKKVGVWPWEKEVK